MKLHRVDTGSSEPTAVIFRSIPTHADKYYLIVQKQQHLQTYDIRNVDNFPGYK